jgi:hypothetical protein
MECRLDSATRRKSVGVFKPWVMMNVEVVSLKPQRTKEVLIARAAAMVEDEGCTVGRKGIKMSNSCQL